MPPDLSRLLFGNPALLAACVVLMGMFGAAPFVCHFSGALMSFTSIVSPGSNSIAVTWVGGAGSYFPLLCKEHQAREG